MKSVQPANSTTTEAARRLGITPEEVYSLVFSGDLDGQPDEHGVVRISEDALVDYERRHRASTS